MRRCRLEAPRRTFRDAIVALARGYYPLVRRIAPHLSRLTPPSKLLTALSLLSIWAAIPCFALGQLGAGALAAWLGVLLELMEGRLALPAFDLSEAMGKREHWCSMPALGLWYLALGWHCSGGNLLEGTPITLATWVLVGAWGLDKMVGGIFKLRHRQELSAYRPLDAGFHLIAARRNLGLVQLSAGVLLDQMPLALVLMAGWMTCTLFFHAGRWVWARHPRHHIDGVAGE